MNAPATDTSRIAQGQGVTDSRTQEDHVWGLDARALHDRRWASRGVQVIRPKQHPDPKGPRLFLLLGHHDFVFFNLAPIMKKLNWVKPKALRIRVIDREAEPYIERITADPDGRFRTIRREYAHRTRSTMRVIMTGDSKTAYFWSSSDGDTNAWRAIRAHAGRERISVCSCSGHILNATHPKPGKDLLADLIKQWANPTADLDGVYEYQRGVFLHETVETPDGVRFAGPIWAGAKVRFHKDDIVIGPKILTDQSVEPIQQRPISWETVRTPGWRITPRLRGRRFRTSKRIFDILFSLAVLIATSPIYPIAMLAIYIEDKKPFFFAHTRQTRRGANFPCYKFRTMRRDAEHMKEQLVQANQADGPQFFIDNDPRVLRVGKIMRRLQIDELPQFWNVLMGHMSVVGPRPSPDNENQFCPTWREARLSVRPGVTGLWQVQRTRAPETDFQEWIRYDLEYAQHESWRLDIWIILKTIEKIFRG